MFVKKRGSVLISTILILSLIIIITNCAFKMMKNNNEMEYLYKHDGDIYNLKNSEKNSLFEFMQELNKEEIEKVFEGDFQKTNSNNTLNYNKEKNIFYLRNCKKPIQERKVKYIKKNKKIILIPTYKIKYIE
ncbi:hypothetical protein [Clostridium uliginosum]|uniref:Uncharacterized protein n=1 Tax=Clostridium uliginosum TaxID=119641 RepID=A0A1I1NLT3_9CLOT|nr:hypothetical protein [Clostridium uliginosum]SFC96438.1 hypothetical protein SAMN05421842_11533 [Clostridium uliginosum]